MPSEGLPLGGRLGGLTALALQYGRYALVGLAATVAHVATYVAGIELWALSPLMANAFGFALGVHVSFLGHRRWTFGSVALNRPGRSLVRFALIAMAGLALNSLFVQLVTGPLRLHHGWAIPLIVGVTPLAAFALSRAWAFRA